MRFLSTLAIFGGLLLPLMAARVDPDTIRALIPLGFQGDAASRDPSSYTIRYLSHDDHSEDSPACLASQLNSSTVAYCNSLRYSLQNSTAAGDPQDGPSTFLILLVSPGDYGFGGIQLEMSHSRNLIIIKNPLLRGEVVFMCETYDDINYNSLYFTRVRNIGVSFLTFAYCGRLSSGFVVSRGENIFVENCITRNNIGGGMILIGVKNITVLNSVFRDNMGSSMYPEFSNLTIVLRKGGGLTITYVNAIDGGSHALVENCTFVNNTATLNENNLEDAKQRPRLYVPRGHGGGILLSFENTIDYRVELRDCLFRGNSANFTGGAAAIQFYRGASNIAAVESSSRENVVVIMNTTFTDNSCSEDGGAVSINAFEGANKNNVFLDGNTFSGNYAGRNGGALSNIIEDNVLANGTEDTELSSIVIIKRSNFSNNEAILDGGAVIIISNARLDQATASALISDCRFVGNKVGTDGTGALLSLRHPITLKDSNIFQGNMGGALSLFQARMDVSGQVLFENNTALNGGGMLMFELSILNLEEGVSVEFLNNHARQQGGAINVVSRSLVKDIGNFTRFYRSCFLQFVNTSALPDNYQSVTGNISFVGNTAVQGGAIYISYLETCTRNKPRYEVEESQENFFSDSIFTANPPFQFKDNVATMSSGSMKGHDIATEPAYFIVTELPSYTEQGNDHNTKRLFIEDEKIVYSQSQDLYVTPGHILHLLLRAVDLLGTSQSAIFSSNFQEGLFALNAEGKVIEHDIDLDDEDAQQLYKSVCSVPYVEGQPLKVLSGQELDFNLLRSIRIDEDVNTFRLNIVVTCCSPGHTLMNTTCVRTGSLEGDQLFLRYTHDRRYFFIQPLFYAHVQNMSGSVVWASMPVFYQDCSKEGERSGCLFKYDDPDDQCADGRTGFLCGKCPNGTSVDLTLTQCIECGPWHAVVIAAIVIGFAVTCALVMIFNIGIPNELRGFLFYIQVVGYVYNYAGIDITWDFHVSNFFGYSSYIPLCLYPGYNALHSAAFGFVFPLTAVATIIIYIISAKFIKHLSNKNSFDGIWFLTFIIYKFTADTCFTILRCQKVNGLSDVTEYVYYYDGDFKCFTGQDTRHLVFATISLLLSVMIILFPIFILVISFKRFQFTVNMTDVLNKDVKESCRWWASFDLFRRLIFSLVLILLNYLWPLYTQLVLFYSGIFVFFVFACTQPYTSKTANISETLVLLNLLVLTAVFLNTDSLRLEGAMALLKALLLLPFIAVFLYLLCKVVYYYWKKYLTHITSLRNLKRRVLSLRTRTNEEFMLHSYEPKLKTSMDEDSSQVHVITSSMDDDFFKFPAHSTPYMHYREELLDDSTI